MRLDTYTSGSFDRGAHRVVEALWIICSGILLESWLPGSAWRKLLLRLFGAQIGAGAVIKSRVRVKFPWRLHIGSHCWIGEDVWIDNLVEVSIGAHSCISQGAYLCTGSHDWTRESFDLIVAPIQIGQSVWVGAHCMLAPGTRLDDGAVLAMGSIAKGELAAGTIHAGPYAMPSQPRAKS